MAEQITGSVLDIADVSMAGKIVELVFRLNAPNVKSATGAGIGTIYPTAEYRVKPGSTGYFAADLANTTLMMGDAWYELGIVWQGSGGPVWDHPQWQIRVDGPGVISEKISFAPSGGWGGPLMNLSMVLVATTKPDNLQVGQLWLQATPGEETNPDPTKNTGRLYKGMA